MSKISLHWMKGDGLMVMGDGLMLIAENQQSTTHNSSPIAIMSFNFDHLLIICEET